MGPGNMPEARASVPSGRGRETESWALGLDRVTCSKCGKMKQKQQKVVCGGT